jgi:hypothetical protein
MLTIPVKLLNSKHNLFIACMFADIMNLAEITGGMKIMKLFAHRRRREQ